MGEVVQLKPAPVKTEMQVYQCECGSQLWFLTPDGRCICSQCNQMTKRLICYDVNPNDRAH